MKKVLLASTALVLSAGVAAADVSVGGSGRMGIISIDGGDTGFTSRIRITFSASGETDGGLTFGGSIRADNAGGGNAGTAGSVFVEGAFGKISMGDVSGAPEAAVGDLSGVGLTGIGDYNEMYYLSNNDRSAARWDYVMGDFGLHVSADNPGSDPATNFTGTSDEAFGIAVTYSMGDISMGLGFEDNGTVDHMIAGVSAGFGDATVKAIYGTADLAGLADLDQYGASLDYVMGATTLTAYYRVVDVSSGGVSVDGQSWGVGAAYDLGGGASLVGGISDGDYIGAGDINGTSGNVFLDPRSDLSYDFGFNMSF